MYKSDNEVKFDITEDGIILGTCKSVAILMIAVAIVMGGRMIYVAGMDGYSKIIENGSSSIHYNKSRPKYNFNKEKKEFLRHYTTVEKYQKRFLREIREYQILHNKEPFKIITPTVFEEHYDPKVLRIR